MKQNSFKAFGLSFLLSLGILVPLLGCFVVYTNWQAQKAETTQHVQSGVPVLGPTAQNDITILVAIAAEQPGFVLLRIDALESRVSICSLPAESVLLSPSGTTLLGKSYQTAGPARAATLLAQTLDITIDRYIAITPATIASVWGQTEPPRINVSGLLEQSELDKQGLTAEPVLSLSPGDATAYLNGLNLPPARLAKLRAAVWEAALRQQLDTLVSVLPEALRKNTASLLTDCTATDFYTLEETLGFLARQEVSFEVEAMPGRYDTAAERFEFGEDSIALAKRVFRPAESTPETTLHEAAPTPDNFGTDAPLPEDTAPSPTANSNGASASTASGNAASSGTSNGNSGSASSNANATSGNTGNGNGASSNAVSSSTNSANTSAGNGANSASSSGAVVIAPDGTTPSPSPTPTIPTAGGLG